MPKKKNVVTEYRSYYLAPDFPLLLLTGDYWTISDVPSGRLHFHNYLEIGICHSESGIMEFYGEPWEFKAGDVTVIPRNIPHTTYSTKGTQSLWSYLYVDLQELIGDMLPPVWKKHPEAMILFQGQEHIIHQDENPYIHTLITRILAELNEQKPNYQLSVRGLILTLYIEFLRIQIAESRGPRDKFALSTEENTPNSLVISPALDYMEQNYMQQFPMDHLAELCHWSPTHFRRVFHEIMGTSPLDYLNNVRIARACNLLRSTEDSILDISEAVGFHSVSSFNRYFAKTMEMTPRDYRKKMLRDYSQEKFSIEEYTGWMFPEKL